MSDEAQRDDTGGTVNSADVHVCRQQDGTDGNDECISSLADLTGHLLASSSYGRCGLCCLLSDTCHRQLYAAK